MLGFSIHGHNNCENTTRRNGKKELIFFFDFKYGRNNKLQLFEKKIKCMKHMSYSPFLACSMQITNCRPALPQDSSRCTNAGANVYAPVVNLEEFF